MRNNNTSRFAPCFCSHDSLASLARSVLFLSGGEEDLQSSLSVEFHLLAFVDVVATAIAKRRDFWQECDADFDALSRRQRKQLSPFHVPGALGRSVCQGVGQRERDRFDDFEGTTARQC